MADNDKHTGYVINSDFSVSEVSFHEESMPEISLNIDPNDEEAWRTAEPRIVTFFTDEVESVQGLLVTGREEFAFHQDKMTVLERAAEMAESAMAEAERIFKETQRNHARAFDAVMKAAGKYPTPRRRQHSSKP